MKNHIIQITQFDAFRLITMLEQEVIKGMVTKRDTAKLREELSRAQIVDPQTIPSGVVTMNSTIDLLDLETGEAETFTIVFPENADGYEGKISVLAPIGTAVLGNSIGDILNFEVPLGTRCLEVKNIVYQPEASGDFHL